MKMNSEKERNNNSSKETHNNDASTSNEGNHQESENVNKELNNNSEIKNNNIYINDELHKIIEAISEKNKEDIDKISNAFLKDIEEMKTNNIINPNNIGNINYKNNNESINNSTNNVPFHIKNFHLTSLNFNQWYTPFGTSSYFI